MRFVLGSNIYGNEWPTSTNKGNNYRIIYKKIWIRPTIKIQDKINEVLNRNDFVENKVIDIKRIWSEDFRDFVKSLDLYKRTDIMKFYKTMNALLNYREKWKIVNGIKVGNEIFLNEDMNKMIYVHYNNFYTHDSTKVNIEYNNWDFRLNVDTEIYSIARNKACGLYHIPSELFKIHKWRIDIKERIKKKFTEWITKAEIPEYFMEARLVLFSKDGTNYPSIDKIRPISILPSINKMLEISILHHLEAAIENPKFNKKQRGFVTEKLTAHNIYDLFSICRKLQNDKQWRRVKNPALLFFDFEKAYDMVPRELLVKKLIDFNIPRNIITKIRDMLEKFRLNFKGMMIKPRRD